jgi:hypothetical protein
MSEEDLKAQIIDAAKVALRDFILDTLKDVQGDLAGYASAIMADFAKFLYQSVDRPAETVDRNLAHLRAQALLLAATRGLELVREAQETLKKIIEAAARVGLKALLAALAAA